MLQNGLYRFASNASVLMLFSWLLSKMNQSSERAVEVAITSEHHVETEEKKVSNANNAALTPGIPGRYSLYCLFSKESANRNNSPSNEGEGLPWTAYRQLLRQ